MENVMADWRNALLGEFPFVVAIGGMKMCAGSLLTLKSVATAGHCIYYDTEYEQSRARKYMYIIAGVVNIDARKIMSSLQERQAISLKVHSKYERRIWPSKTILFDVGLIYLSNPFKETEFVRPLHLISTITHEFKRGYQQVVERQEKCFGIEWHFNFSNFERKLMVTELIPKSSDFCSNFQKFKGVDQTSHGEVCLISADPNRSDIYCDTGGPLVCKSLAYGVLSSGFGSTTEPFYYFLFWHYLEFYGIGKSLTSLFNPDLALICAIIVLIFLHD